VQCYAFYYLRTLNPSNLILKCTFRRNNLILNTNSIEQKNGLEKLKPAAYFDIQLLLLFQVFFTIKQT